jgi:hypothetical protein
LKLSDLAIHVVKEGALLVCAVSMSFPSRFGTISSPAALLAELRSFSRTRGSRRKSWPLALPAGDASALVAGKKPLLALHTQLESSASSTHTTTTPFHFKCTNCGNCCKTLPAAVRIDIIDAWRMTKLNPTKGLFPLSNFSRAVGLFDIRALIEGGIAARVTARISMRLNQVRKGEARPVIGQLKGDDDEIVTTFGTAPITFLRPSPTTSRCGFAVDTSSSHGEGLTCSLSTHGMPLTCSLYPLGHFLHTDRRVDGSSTHFFTVDERGCEGIVKVQDKDNITASTTTVNENISTTLEAYALRNGLLPRYYAAEWSRGLSTAWACSGIEAHAAGEGGNGLSSSLPTPSLIALRERIRKIWETPRVVAGVESNPDAEWNEEAAICVENASIQVAETYWNTIREGREYK